MATDLENYMEAGAWLPLTDLPLGMIGRPLKVVSFTEDGDLSAAFSGEMVAAEVESNTHAGADGTVLRSSRYRMEVFFREAGGDAGQTVWLHTPRIFWKAA